MDLRTARRTAAEPHRDLVVVGAAAGGATAAGALLAQLPSPLAAAVVVAQQPDATSDSGGIVRAWSHLTALPVRWVEQGARVEYGVVYVVPPRLHAVFLDDHLQLINADGVGSERPSIDRLFRSAAIHHDGYCIGVLLHGTLGDGIGGLHSIQRAGGRTLVQDRADVARDDGSVPAFRTGVADRQFRIGRIGDVLADALAERPGEASAERPNAMVAAVDPTLIDPDVPLACPECGAALHEDAEAPGAGRMVRCAAGHAFRTRSLLAHNDVQLEDTLWSASRGLLERGKALELLADESREHKQLGLAIELEQRATEGRQQAAQIRRFLIELQRGVR